MANGKGSITEFYDGRSIFITGGTGFMGKVMVEKLLYACTGIKTIYLLLRNKRGKTPQQRIEEMWTKPLFERLRKSQPDAMQKVVPVYGELSQEGLGMKISDVELLINNVSVVFHMAATLKLEAKLKDAIEQNTSGTARIVDVCKKMKNLKAFVHFSTAFCSADIDEFEERTYPNKDNPRDVMEIARWLNPEALEIATPSIIAPHPNTYTYSKRLAETLIADELENMPVCIIRPSIVTPSVKEPVPGWVDSLNGPVGLLVGAGKGVIRSMHCKGENRGQFIPVDYAINTSIVIAQIVGTAIEKPKQVPVYNLTQDAELKITYREILDRGRDLVYQNPFEMQVWYPDGDIRASKFVHNIYSLFFHWIPAILIDLIMLLCGQKTFMIRIQKKIYDGLELLEFFAVREWVFRSEKFLALHDTLSDRDKDLFATKDFHTFSVEQYLTACVLGTRQYCMKEDLSSLPRCRQKQKVLYVVHKLAVYGFYFYIFYLLSCYSATVKFLYDIVRNFISYIPIIGYLMGPATN